MINVTGIKIIFSGIFFISTFLCSTLPVCLFSWLRNRQKSSSTRSHFSLFSLNTLINCVTCFGGGIFLGACLLDLLPEVIHHIDLTLKTEFQYDNQALKRYPIAEILIACGLFLVLFIEQAILSCQTMSTRPTAHLNKKPPIILAHDDDDETSLTNINDQDPLMTRTSLAEHRFDMSEQKEDLVTNKNRVLLTRIFVLLLSLIIHSIFEGVALGATKEYKSSLELFFAIIIHKSIIAFSVGLKLMNMTHKRLVYFACFILSIATPFGILVVVSMEELLPDNRTAKIIHDILRAFACGTFFYITFFDVLPHALNMSTRDRHFSSTVSSGGRLLKVMCVFIGFSFIALLSFMMK